MSGFREARVIEIMRRERVSYNQACAQLGAVGGRLTQAKRRRAREVANRASAPVDVSKRWDLRGDFL